MFRKKEHKKRGSFLPFVIFRTCLSLTIFAFLLMGVFQALQQFSGIDPLKGNPRALINSVFSQGDFVGELGKISTQIGLPAVVSSKIASKISPTSEVAGIHLSEATPTNVPKPAKTSAKPLFSFLLVADSHSENNYLAKAISQAKDNYPNLKFIIGLGDYTEVGTIDELKNAKNEFDQGGLRYYVLPGDHDLWDARDKGKLANDNFSQVFGPAYQSFIYQRIEFLLLDNSDNYKGIKDDQFSWLKDQLVAAKQDNPSLILAFLHEPLYHPSSDHVMGMVTPILKNQAKDLTKMIKEGGVKHVFAGDIHFFTEYTDPETGLDMTTIGAIASQRNVQAPRYSVVTIYEDNSLQVEDIEIK